MPRPLNLTVRTTPYIIRHPHVCQRCEKPVAWTRPSTPRIPHEDGYPRFWCKKCWKKIGGYNR